MTANPHVLSADSLEGTKVVNKAGDSLGKIEDLMIDISGGRVRYAVLSFGGFLGFGDKYFAIPWSALDVDTDHEQIVFDVTKERLEKAEGFDKDNWPDFADTALAGRIYDHFGQKPYWI